MRILVNFRRAGLAAVALCLLSFGPPAWAEDRALFWSISDAGGHRGYLLGTIHSEDPRVLEFSEQFLEMLGTSKVFAMELVPSLPTLARLTDYMHLPDGSSLEDLLGTERFSRVTAALASYRVPAAQVARMKPWAAMMTLSVPPPETGLFMDFSLSLRASGGGLKVIGLETLEEQLAFLEEMPTDQQLALLDHAVAEFARVREVHDRMVDIYLDGDLVALHGQAREQLATIDEAARRYFMEQGIDARNERMLAALVDALSEGAVFAAVGALHLPGEKGLLALLRNRGYQLRALGSPFPQP